MVSDSHAVLVKAWNCFTSMDMGEMMTLAQLEKNTSRGARRRTYLSLNIFIYLNESLKVNYGLHRRGSQA